MRGGATYLVVNILLLGLAGALRAGEPAKIEKHVVLHQQDFVLSGGSQELDEWLSFTTESGVVQTAVDLSAPAASNLQAFARITISQMEIMKCSADQGVYSILSYDRRQERPVRPIGMPVARTTVEAHYQSLPPWVDACDLVGVRLSMAGVATNITYIELVCRLAVALELEVGIVDSGAMILGRRGQWLPSFKPTHTLKIKESIGNGKNN